MIEAAAIVVQDVSRSQCWICHDPLKAKRPCKTATGLCTRCYSREYQRSVRTGEPQVRTPEDVIRLNRADLRPYLDNLPAPAPPAEPTLRQRDKADRTASRTATAAVERAEARADAAQAEVDKLRARLALLRPVAQAAQQWYRGPYLAANAVRLKGAVESLNRADGASSSRLVDPDD